jgi:hypothetical protein
MASWALTTIKAMRALAFLVILAVGFSAAQRTPALQLAIQYRVNSEDGSAGGDVFRLPVGSQPSPAVVWEQDCRLGGAPNVTEPPAPADQYWTFEAVEESPRGARQIRIRYRVVVSGAAKPAPLRTHTIALDKPAPLVLQELSARRDCRYDRLTISVSVPQR